MPPTAAPGRQQIVRSLQRALEGLQQRRDEIEAYLKWVEKQVDDLLSSPSITENTTCVYDVQLIVKVVNFINYRSSHLRKRGCNLSDSWTLDAEALITNNLKPPQGMETGNVMLKKATIEVKPALRLVLRQLEELEQLRVRDWISHLSEYGNVLLEREKTPRFHKWLETRREVESLRDVMQHELNPDAVWLREPRDKLDELAESLSCDYECPKDDEWPKVVQEHEMVVYDTLEEAEALRIRVGRTQRLVTEYFFKV